MELGLSCNKIGSMDSSLVKLLSLHIPSFHPPSSTDLEVEISVQTASLIGMGLLYMKTAHRHTAEVLLSQIACPPTLEDDLVAEQQTPSQNNNSSNHLSTIIGREAYSLSAGIALGFVTLGMGGTSAVGGISDLHLEEVLSCFIHGSSSISSLQDTSLSFSPTSLVNISNISNAATMNTKKKSILVEEGQRINTYLTAPGAIMALTLMYLKTNNISIASRLDIPQNKFLLNFIRPDLFLLRTLCKNMILWDNIQPTHHWIESQIPFIIQESINSLKNSSIDKIMFILAHIFIITGACLAISIRFAGTFHKQSYNVLLDYFNYFKQLQKKKTNQNKNFDYNHDEVVVPLQSCIDMLALSLSLVMAGSGNMETFKILKKMSQKVPIASTINR